MAVFTLYRVVRKHIRRKNVEAEIRILRSIRETIRREIDEEFKHWEDNILDDVDMPSNIVEKRNWILNYMGDKYEKEILFNIKIEKNISKLEKIKRQSIKSGFLEDAASIALQMALTEEKASKLQHLSLVKRYVYTNSLVLGLAFDEISKTEFKVDMKAWRDTLNEYRAIFDATAIDALVKRVSEVCSKLARYRFLINIPTFRAAATASAIEQKRFYSKQSKWAGQYGNPKDLMFGEWMMSQAHGWRFQGNYGKKRRQAMKWLPRLGTGIPKMDYGRGDDFYGNLRFFTHRFINIISKPKPGKLAGFLAMAIAVGANKMINGNHGVLTPDRNSNLLRRPSRYWAARAKTATEGSRWTTRSGKSRKTGGGVRIGFGKVYGTRRNPSARVFVPGSMFRRAVQPYVSSLFSQDSQDMQGMINKEVKKKQRESFRSGRILASR